MAINQINFSDKGIREGKTTWHKITTPDSPCRFRLSSVGLGSVIEIKNTFLKTPLNRSALSFSFIDSAGSVISSGVTVAPGSTALPYLNASVVPLNAVFLDVSGAQDMHFSITASITESFAELPAPTVYTTSQSITVNTKSVVSLLGGGAGGGNTGSSGVSGGGGSGFITNGTVNAGTYTLVIGAGGNGGVAGGSTTFAGFTAAGGNSGGNGYGGSGGSNAGYGVGVNNVRPGTNGSPGSGKAAVLFSAGPAPVKSVVAGGGVYCGGSSGGSNANGTPVGSNGAAANGYGGGGSGASSNNNGVNAIGGAGGAGALWVVPTL